MADGLGGSLFNVIGFGSRMEKALPDFAVYSDTTMRQVEKTVSRWTANLGGTLIAQPISESRCHIAKRTVTILLTDGMAEDAHEARRLAAENKAMIYTLGIGEDTDRGVLNDIARLSGGKARFITRERVEGAVMEHLRDAAGIETPFAVDWSPLSALAESGTSDSPD
eukprot:m51a1_g2362 hypothetical protein (167) ;mRNA; f:634497-635154